MMIKIKIKPRKKLVRFKESQREESNLRPADYESAALPSELRWPDGYVIFTDWVFIIT